MLRIFRLPSDDVQRLYQSCAIHLYTIKEYLESNDCK